MGLNEVFSFLLGTLISRKVTPTTLVKSASVEPTPNLIAEHFANVRYIFNIKKSVSEKFRFDTASNVHVNLSHKYQV